MVVYTVKKGMEHMFHRVDFVNFNPEFLGGIYRQWHTFESSVLHWFS